MPVKRLSANLIEQHQCWDKQMHNRPRAGKQPLCKTTGGDLANQGGSLLREKRICFLLFCLSFQAFLAFVCLLIVTHYHKCLLISPVIHSRKMQGELPTKWVSEWTHTGKKQRADFMNMSFVDTTQISYIAPELYFPGSFYCLTVCRSVQRRRLQRHHLTDSSENLLKSKD